jgi:hypothetical protein
VFKVIWAGADECDVENDHHVAEHRGSETADAPSLPPRLDPPAAADVWDDVEPEHEMLYHYVDRATGHTPIFLLPTAIARLLATAGWMGTVVAGVLLLAALVPSFEVGETRNFMIPLDEGPWFGATVIVSTVVVYLGWLWWTLSAAFNARRVAPLSTSPWLPTMVYLVGPLIVLIGLDGEDPWVDVVVFCGLAWICIGHLIVVASFKGTAGRIGASVDEFSKLLWLPIASGVYRVCVNTLLANTDDQWRKPVLLFALGAVSVLFLVGMAVATWRATESFDHAVRRLNTRSLGLELPSADMVTAAIRKRALEGR